MMSVDNVYNILYLQLNDILKIAADSIKLR